MKSKVLDKGFIEVVDSLGNDLTVVNSARVSFGKRKEKFDKSDERLVRYLAKYKHYSPFRHLQVQFHIKAPEFAWNEISGRYVPVEDYYHPSVWRKQSDDNKQASEGVLDDLQQARMNDSYEALMQNVRMTYDRMVAAGMAKEQARIILPLNQYTEVYWTASFQAIVNFIELRDEKTSQWEIQEYAKVMKSGMVLKKYLIKRVQYYYLFNVMKANILWIANCVFYMLYS